MNNLAQRLRLVNYVELLIGCMVDLFGSQPAKCGITGVPAFVVWG